MIGFELEAQIKPLHRGQKLFHELHTYLNRKGFIPRDLRSTNLFGYEFFEFDAFFSRKRAEFDARGAEKLELRELTHGIRPGRGVQVVDNALRLVSIWTHTRR
jgi:hypothetical protein